MDTETNDINWGMQTWSFTKDQAAGIARALIANDFHISATLGSLDPKEYWPITSYREAETVVRFIERVALVLQDPDDSKNQEYLIDWLYEAGII